MNIPKEKFTIVGSQNSEAERLARPHISYFKDTMRRLKESKTAMVALVILILMCVMVIIGPYLSGYAFEEIDTRPEYKNAPPSSEHWFGTDKLGRDLFSRVWQAGRVSLAIGLVGAAVAAIVGCIYGGISAYFGGKVDTVMMRIVEVITSIPYLIVVILLSVVLESKSLGTLILALTITGWCGTARLVRGQILQLKNQEFVMAAQALGVRPMRIIMKHLIPNTMSTIIVSITFAIPNYIFSEAFLSFIGLGIQPPNTSWGALSSAAQAQFLFYPYQLLFPSVMIALTMLSFTLLGDGLRDALDPKLRK